MIRFKPVYFFLALLLVGIDIFIVDFLNDAVIRPYGGDLLWSIFLYCLVCGFIDRPVVPIAISVLLFCYLEEILQYFHLADRLGFTKPSLMRTLIGTSFTWVDILCYTLGIGIVLILERGGHLARAKN